MIEDKAEIFPVRIGDSKQNHKKDRFGSPDTFFTVGNNGNKTLFNTVADRMRDRHFFLTKQVDEIRSRVITLST